MIFEAWERDEIEAFNKVIKGRKVNVLVGVGSFGHVRHCFALGFPDTMVLIDPQWSDEKTLGYDISLLEQFKDKDVPLKFINTSSTVDTIEFYFGGQKKTVHFYKVGYNPGVLGRFQPDVFHIGHAVIGYMPFERVLESLPVLRNGTIIMNITKIGYTEPVHPLGHFPLEVYANYFLSVACAYTDKEKMREDEKFRKSHYENFGEKLGEMSETNYTNYIYKKTQDIDEKESVLVYKFARAFDDFCDCLENRQNIKELEAQVEELRRQGKIIEAKEIVQHKKDIAGLPKTLKTVWAVFTIAQKKKLIKLIYDFAGNKKELAEEAIEIANLD